ncbi:hypothetical protein [Candidatus Oscillochloris fontis]|uniref:hypothetical protein n=1 Tax=Candidatus Oscillochloris fontis TaxID=2496868 RepID=UPI00101B62D6|nr:hypothetical protein [Candidatus Oscillochloris fontis]
MMVHDIWELEATERVLVAILPHQRDLELAREAGWYRVPLARLPSHFAAEYLAFYQPAIFGAERWTIRYYAPVLRYRIALRRELLPAEPQHPRAEERYYQIDIGPLATLPLPIPARRLRRVSFINTTIGQLRRAHDVADLFHPAEDAQPPDEIWGAGLAGHSLT